MYKNGLKKKAAAAVLSCLMIVGTGGVCNAQNMEETHISNNGSMLRFATISETTSSLTKGTSGKMQCQASTSVWSGYIAGVKAELQYYVNGDWTTIVTWTDSDWDYASISNNYYVEKGYNYRLKTTHYSYDRNWNQIESTIQYTNTVSY